MLDSRSRKNQNEMKSTQSVIPCPSHVRDKATPTKKPINDATSQSLEFPELIIDSDSTNPQREMRLTGSIISALTDTRRSCDRIKKVDNYALS